LMAVGVVLALRMQPESRFEPNPDASASAAAGLGAKP
jgi:MFS transporter, ACS family, glucarate transporter